jgi:hypothetical protein
VSEKTIDQETIREEHLKEVHQPAQWAYMLGVILGGTVLMLGFIALLGAGAQ